MSTQVQKVHMLILMQPDIAQAIDFYQKLGLKLVFHIKEKWAEMQLGDIKIGLVPTAQAREWHLTGIVLQVEDLEKAYNELKETIEFVKEPKVSTHGVMASFKDPGGNVLDLYQPTPEKITELVKKTVDKDDKSDDAGCAKKGASCCKNKKQSVAQG